MSRCKLEKYADYLDNEYIKNLSNSDILWTKIKSIEYVGMRKTYDIQIDNTTNLYALNGFITHNSAIFEAILWSLFNKSRTAAIDDVIMWGESNCTVVFEFLHHGEHYKVVRKRSRSAGTSTVEFYVEDNGNWIDKSGSTARLTNDEIISIIRVDYKTFINSAYFRQNDISEFAESDAGRKKDILKSIIDISKWDEYEKSVKTGIKELKKDCTILEAESLELEEAQTTLEDSKLNLVELNKQVEFYGTERERLASKIEFLSEKYTTLKQNLDTDQWDKITEENTRLHALKATLEGKKVSLDKEISKYRENIKDLDSKAKSAERESLEIIIDPDASVKLAEIRAERNKYQTEVNSSKERLDELGDVDIEPGSCYVCGQSVSDELSDKLHREHQNKVNNFEKRVVFGKNRVLQLDAEIKEMEAKVKNNSRYEILVASIKKILSESEMLSGHLTRIVSESKDVISSLQEADVKLKSNEDILASLRNEDFNSIRLQIKESKDKRTMVQASLEAINRDVGIYSQKVINLTEKIGKMTKSQQELSEKRQNLIVLEKFAKLLGKNGIQTILLNAVIDDLETTSNNVLTSICNEPFQIILETQRDGSDGVSVVDTLDLKVKKDGTIQNFKSLSGGEQFRISLALRIALSEISSKHGGSSLDFLLLDEINSPLDRNGTENLFINVIKSLEKRYKILVITHDDMLKDKFDNILDVTKINGESSAKFISK
jgi:exonuclease SbcC